MKHAVLAFTLALASAVAFGQPGQSAPTTAAPAQPPSADKFAEQMKKMQDMHKHMQAAKTPAERQALLDEHMKLMQSGMAMMSQMGGAQGMGMGGMAGGARPNASAPQTGGPMGPGGMGGMMDAQTNMEHRMAMMEQMMQMMVDRQAATPRK